MSDWTPGPWTVFEQGNGLALVDGPAEVHADRPYLRIADARLIAAAPELATMLARAVHDTDLTGEMWRKDALALLNRIAAQKTES